MPFPPGFADRLAKLLGMVGSAHDGEALNAARLADRMVFDAGLTWASVLGIANGTSPDVDLEAVSEACFEIMGSGMGLSYRERSILTGLPRFRRPTEKQIVWLNDLLERARAFAAQPPPPPPPPPKPRKTRAPGKRQPFTPRISRVFGDGLVVDALSGAGEGVGDV